MLEEEKDEKWKIYSSEADGVMACSTLFRERRNGHGRESWMLSSLPPPAPQWTAFAPPSTHQRVASPQASLICITSDGHKKGGISPIGHGMDRMFLSGTEQPSRCLQAVWNLSEGRPWKATRRKHSYWFICKYCFSFLKKKRGKVVFCFNHTLFTPLLWDAYPPHSLGNGK